MAATPLAYAQSSLTAIALGARKGIEHVSLSPDGDKVAYIIPDKGQGSRLYTVDLTGDGQAKVTLVASGNPERLSYCEWVSNGRSICLVWSATREAGEPVTVSRLIAVNADGTGLKLVTMRQGNSAERFCYFGGNLIDLLFGYDGAALMDRESIPEGKTGSLTPANPIGNCLSSSTLKKISALIPMRSIRWKMSLTASKKLTAVWNCTKSNSKRV